MSINLKVLNASAGETISVEVDDTESAGDIIVFAAQYWNKDRNAFVMKVGNKLIPSNVIAGDLGLKNGDTVVLVPDPQGG